MKRLASSKDHIIPGHDPLVLTCYPTVIDGVDDIVRLDADPLVSRRPNVLGTRCRHHVAGRRRVIEGP